MQWKCVSNITWDGDLSGCTFTDTAVQSLVLVSYLLCAATSEVQLGLEMIQKDVRLYAAIYVSVLQYMHVITILL